MTYTTLISTEELAALLNSPNWVFVDCRFSLKDKQQGRNDYLAGHIPSARYAHLDNDLSGEIIPGTTGRHPLPEIDAFAAKLGSWGIDNTTQVVAYDDMGGAIAARLWVMLKWLGHEAVAVLDGGWQKWVAENKPIESQTIESQARSFKPNLQTDLIVDASAVASAVEDAHVCLVDARAAERYAGIHEPLDPVAGHIPSALSYPWQENLDENKCFHPPETLLKRFEALSSTPIIAYCGSGVTAAHNMLAITHAGLPMPRLYAGSWSHWITLPNHIVATNP